MPLALPQYDFDYNGNPACLRYPPPSHCGGGDKCNLIPGHPDCVGGGFDICDKIPDLPECRRGSGGPCDQYPRPPYCGGGGGICGGSGSSSSSISSGPPSQGCKAWDDCEAGKTPAAFAASSSSGSGGARQDAVKAASRHPPDCILEPLDDPLCPAVLPGGGLHRRSWTPVR